MTDSWVATWCLMETISQTIQWVLTELLNEAVALIYCRAKCIGHSEINCIHPHSGWLLRYDLNLKCFSAARTEGLGRFCHWVDGHQIINSHNCLCKAGPDIPNNTQNNYQYKMDPASHHFVRKSRVETQCLLLSSYIDCNQHLKNVSEKCKCHTND
jgi:hypothetical protein